MHSIVLHSEFLCQWRIFGTVGTYFIYLDHRHIILWTLLQSLSSLILHLPPDEEPHRTPLLPPLLCSGLSTAWCKVWQKGLFSIQFSFSTSQSVLSENRILIMRNRFKDNFAPGVVATLHIPDGEDHDSLSVNFIDWSLLQYMVENFILIVDKFHYLEIKEYKSWLESHWEPLSLQGLFKRPVPSAHEDVSHLERELWSNTRKDLLDSKLWSQAPSVPNIKVSFFFYWETWFIFLFI